jgi:hypothetical protein
MNRMFRLTLAAALLSGAAAFADSGAATTYTKDTYPTQLVLRPLELPAGMVQVGASLDINMSSSINDTLGNTLWGPFKPFLIGLQAQYGVDGHLQLGISSSGLCFTDACGHTFNDFSLEADYGFLHQQGLDGAFQGALLFNNLADSVMLGVAVGVDLRMVQGQFAIRAGPKLKFGLTNRDGGNTEAIDVPLAFQFQVDPHLALELRSDIVLGLNPVGGTFGDYLQIPVQLSGIYAVNKMFDVGAYFAFTNLLGKSSTILDQTGLDGRQLGFFALYRL